MGGRNRSQTYDEPLFEDGCGAAVLGRRIRQVAGERHVLVEFVERVEIGQRGQLAAGALGQEQEQRRDDREQLHGSAAHFHRDWTTAVMRNGAAAAAGVKQGGSVTLFFVKLILSGLCSAISVASCGEESYVFNENTW